MWLCKFYWQPHQGNQAQVGANTHKQGRHVRLNFLRQTSFTSCDYFLIHCPINDITLLFFTAGKFPLHMGTVFFLSSSLAGHTLAPLLCYCECGCSQHWWARFYEDADLVSPGSMPKSDGAVWCRRSISRCLKKFRHIFPWGWTNTPTRSAQELSMYSNLPSICCYWHLNDWPSHWSKCKSQWSFKCVYWSCVFHFLV